MQKDQNNENVYHSKMYFFMRNAVIILVTVCFLPVSIYAQDSVVINGPKCVVPGAEYQYNYRITGVIVSGAQLCVQGGKISGISSACTGDFSKGFVKVIWNSGVEGKLSFTSSNANNSLSVQITAALDPGKINVG